MSGEQKKSLLTLEQVLEATGGIHVLGTGDFYFTSVQTDSRAVVQGTLFVPLIGEMQDGHKYVPQAIENGATAVIIRLKNFEDDGNFFAELSQKNPHVVFVGVENTLTALQKTAARYVEEFPRLIKVAVTGSSGKTTTKEILAAILRQKYSVVTNKGNLNSETGLPLSVFGIDGTHQVGVFEMGMNREGEIGEISAVLKPRFAIVTNIGTAHIGLLGSRENIAREKARVFDHFHGIGTGVIPADDDFAAFLAEQVDGNIVRYGEGLVEGVKFIADMGLGGTKFSVDGAETTLRLPGKYNYRNALGAIALAKVLGVGAEQIALGIDSVRPLFGRSEVVHGTYTVLRDCYNANPDSMKKSVEFFSSVEGAPGTQRVMVLGDMFELGESSATDHAAVGKLAAASGVDCVVFVGEQMKFAFDAANDSKTAGGRTNFFFVHGKDDDAMAKAAEAVRAAAVPGSSVLLKGSRGMGLERVIKILEGEE